MTAADLLAALDLPTETTVSQRIPKTLLVENGAPTAADKRLINEGVERLWWWAAIKPSNSGVPEFRDEVRQYLEIAVLELTIRTHAKAARLIELTHRAVPYPVVLVATEQSGLCSLSMAHKRWSQSEADHVVLEGHVVCAEDVISDESSITNGFLHSLAISRQPRTSLYDLYQGWIDVILALRAAELTGSFVPARSAQQATARGEALRECAAIAVEMAALRAAAIKTTQVARRAEINIEIQRLQARHMAAKAQL